MPPDESVRAPRGHGYSPSVRSALRGRAGRLGAASPLALLLLAAIVVGGFVLRVWNNDYGLPYVYSYDEETHFVSKAVDMFGGGFDPDYYQNPSGFTYIVHVALRLLYGDLPGIGSVLDLPLETVTSQFALDPTPIWIISRSLAALLAVAGVAAVFYVGRRLWDTRVALVGAAGLSFAFLAVVYGRIAVTDAGTLPAVALAVYGAVKVYEGGARRHYLLAGAGTGLAIGFKYTAGLVLVPLLAAALFRALGRADESERTPRALGRRARAAGVRGTASAGLALRRDREAISFVLGLVAVGVVFFLTTPFFFLDPISALYQLKTQAEAAGGAEKLGQTNSSGLLFYFGSLTWGLGWLGLAAALAGAVIEWRRDRRRAIVLLLFPLLLIAYMSSQSRFFARWILPVYPVLALLCGVTLVQLASLLRSRPGLQPVALAVLTLVLLAQPLIGDLRTASVLGQTDTRNAARDFLVDRYPAELRVAIEPALPVVPDVYYRARPGDGGPETADLCTGLAKGTNAGATAPSGCTPVDRERFPRELLRDARRAATDPESGPNANLTLYRPELIDLYRAEGYCTVVTMSTVRERAENAGDRRVLGYYDRLERESDVIFEASPFRRGSDPPAFDFDLSFNYLPRAYERPGPNVRMFRLRDCRQQFGEVAEKPAGTRGLMKGVGTTFVGNP